MRKNLHFVILLLLAVMSFGLQAQNTAIVHGYVTDSVSREPVPYATIQLQNLEGTLINGAITDAGGRFTMKDVPFGEHSFIVSFVGYRTKKITKEIKEKEQWVGIGIVLENKLLQEVNVVGEKVLMKEEVDKTVYRLDDFVLRNSPTVLEAMKSILGVTVKVAEESIRVNGNKNVLVLVDGMYSSRSLTTINPEDVQSVEIITNPSVEYDSEVANVVNIILKEERKQDVFDLGYVDYGRPQYNGLEMSLVAALEMELPWDLTFEAEFVYDGRKRLYNGYEYSSPLIETLALSRGFLNDKLIVELDMNGFFLGEKTEEMVSVPGYYSLNRAEQRMPSVSLFVRYVFKGGDRKMAQIEERESLMESEKDAVQRK